MDYFDGKIKLIPGDSADMLGKLDSETIDSVVTDPPYGIDFMGRGWDTIDGVAFSSVFWAEVFRVLKPGGHLIAFSGARTYHRMAVAVEDGGFEIRDQIMWLYGSGFPKSHNVSKAIDKASGAEREVTGTVKHRDIRNGHGRGVGDGINASMRDGPVQYLEHPITAPATDAAKQWDGWGTALKPAHEPLVLARKPFKGTVAKNVLEHGTGAINIDECRVHAEDVAIERKHHGGGSSEIFAERGNATKQPPGRWPANVIHDGSQEVMDLFPETKSGTGAIKRTSAKGTQGNALGKESRPEGTPMSCIGDQGSAARFFYTAKADAHDRLAANHPTVKPLDLMQYLCRLVTPKGGLILDPFAGTGTTGEAAWREGFSAILMECDEEYQGFIRQRLELANKPEKRSAVANTKGDINNYGPLFDVAEP